ncbi:MAG: hypothetical protein KJ923_00430, partial [Candidatus Omnitrophica bacterium]|nr:hypothetical protein [Candidatus Omnitrophota bacterium]
DIKSQKDTAILRVGKDSIYALDNSSNILQINLVYKDRTLYVKDGSNNIFTDNVGDTWEMKKNGLALIEGTLDGTTYKKGMPYGEDIASLQENLNKRIGDINKKIGEGVISGKKLASVSVDKYLGSQTRNTLQQVVKLELEIEKQELKKDVAGMQSEAASLPSDFRKGAQEALADSTNILNQRKAMLDKVESNIRAGKYDQAQRLLAKEQNLSVYKGMLAGTTPVTDPKTKEVTTLGKYAKKHFPTIDAFIDSKDDQLKVQLAYFDIAQQLKATNNPNLDPYKGGKSFTKESLETALVNYRAEDQKLYTASMADTGKLFGRIDLNNNWLNGVSSFWWGAITGNKELRNSGARQVDESISLNTGMGGLKYLTTGHIYTTLSVVMDASMAMKGKDWTSRGWENKVRNFLGNEIQIATDQLFGGKNRNADNIRINEYLQAATSIISIAALPLMFYNAGIGAVTSILQRGFVNITQRAAPSIGTRFAKYLGIQGQRGQVAMNLLVNRYTISEALTLGVPNLISWRRTGELIPVETNALLFTAGLLTPASPKIMGSLAAKVNPTIGRMAYTMGFRRRCGDR